MTGGATGAGAADIAFAGVAAQAHLLASGQLTARALCDLVLERIGRLDGRTRAFVQVGADAAREQAAACDSQLADGDRRPLLGVPLAIKNNVATAGYATRHGTSSDEPVATADDEAVRRLRAAGAVIVGTTTLPELAVWGFTESPATGATRNPWDLSRSPGGSSGGSAAAVAAGLVPGALASDGAGSIRLPAAATGLVGLKPTRDLVPLGPTDRPHDHWNGMSVYGALTRRIVDSALLTSVLAGTEITPAEPGALRVGMSVGMAGPASPVGAEALAAMDVTRGALRSLGHTVDDHDAVAGPALEVLATVAPLYFTGVADDLAALVDPWAVSPRVRQIAAIGRALHPLRAGAVTRAARIAERVDRVFDAVDVLVQPVLAQPQLPIGAYDGYSGLRTMLAQSRYSPFTVLWNLTGQPSLALPVCQGRGGLPVAVQLVGRRGSEALLLGVGLQLERLLGWEQRRPTWAT